MVNKGLPWMFILGMSALLLLAVFGLWSGLSGASGSFLPSFSIFWLLGVALLASGGWMIYKLKIVRGLILILLALVAFQIPGTTSGPTLERKVVAVPATLAEKGGNLLVTGTTKSAAELAAERKAAAEENAEKMEADAKAQVRADNAAAREIEATRLSAKAVPCLRRYEKQLNCFTVKFGYNTVYERTALKDHCIIYDPVDAVQRVDVGGNQYQFIGPSGLTAQFFDVPIGKWTFEGKEVKCGV